ncbi:hypothetical protein M2333_000915 [Sphingobium sp. B11D3B]|uniref:hypothetical protein n=1 Tax=Sphingobium sp. B11D3B TaxID=2940575 RepID=UPI0022277821|nr:hypothetical protein [Sphingobium sp. B11D3B]MCW2387869.1 hypothetical protein [Sphingobium sp. B11D3B]
MLGLIAVGVAWVTPILFPPLSERLTEQASAQYYDGTAPVLRLPSTNGKAPVEEERCNERWPVKVRFHNSSSETINAIHFSIKATRPGYSTNLVVGYPTYETDLILQPSQSMWQCISVPVAEGYNAKSLRYDVEVQWVDTLE